MAEKILVTGGSIAANASAWWLTRHGFDVVVLERASSFREGGQNVDVRGRGREVLRKMGLEERAFEYRTGEQGTVWVSDSGEAIAEFRSEETGDSGPTARLEILRGDLAAIIYEEAKDRVEFRFDDRIVGVADGEDGVRVKYEKGSDEEFACVVVAEGVGSSTRELAFPDENDPRYMNCVMAYYTIPRRPDDDRMWRWYNAPGGRSISLRPDLVHDTTRVNLTVQKEPEGEQNFGAEEARRFLRETFEDAGWQADRVLAGMEQTDDFYFETLRQVRMPRWSKDRVCLTGDAAWCVTPLGGMGASLALVGAYVLAGELSLHDSVHAAFDRYEKVMRPMVDAVQDVPKIGPRLMNPHSRLGINLLHGVLAAVDKARIDTLFAKLSSDKGDEMDLPEYQ